MREGKSLRFCEHIARVGRQTEKQIYAEIQNKIKTKIRFVRVFVS